MSDRFSKFYFDDRCRSRWTKLSQSWHRNGGGGVQWEKGAGNAEKIFQVQRSNCWYENAVLVKEFYVLIFFIYITKLLSSYSVVRYQKFDLQQNTFLVNHKSGRVVYEWEQTLDEIKIYLKPPLKAKAKVTVFACSSYPWCLQIACTCFV